MGLELVGPSLERGLQRSQDVILYQGKYLLAD